jgi:Legionella pneumophila major outer membrane protein precursor
MVPSDCWIVLLLCVGGWSGLAGPLAAQTTPGTTTAPPAAQVASNPLPGLPHPPDQPATLLMPVQPVQPYLDADPMPPCYFVTDPLLDPPWLQPGWFAEVDATLGVPRVLNKLTNSVGLTPATSMPAIPIALPSAPLDFTVMPRVEAGYRLPSGFGEFALNYRGLSSSGNDTIAGIDGLASLHSRLDVNIIGLDYASREFSLGFGWGMKWWVGVQLTYIYFDSLASQSAATAAAGSGILSEHETNSYVGGGPNVGLEVSRNVCWECLSLLGRMNLYDNIGRIKQSFFADSLALGLVGTPFTGDGILSSSQAVPEAQGQLGIAWQPAEYSNLRVFAGYEIDYWWNVGRFSLTTSRAQMYYQGVMLQAQVNF